MSICDRLQHRGVNTYLLGIFLLVVSVLMSLLVITPTVNAAPGKINYQGRLTDAAGTAKPDGQYNMKFRIYDSASGGTLLWSETRETTNRVTVTNGQFNVRLGAVTTIPDSVFTSDTTYFEVELPTPATATCSTSSCGVYTEGAMSPRQSVSSSAYAMQANNASTLDGIDSTSFARSDSFNTFSSSNTFNNTVTLGSTNSNLKFSIKDSTNQSLFIADTSAMVVRVGSLAAGTLANVRLITTSAEFSGVVRVGTATNGIDFSGTSGILLSGNARPTRTVTLVPEYPGATFRGNGTNENGSLSSDFCASLGGAMDINAAVCNPSGESHNYYEWVSGESTYQQYFIYVRYRLPSDYDTGSMTNLTMAAQAETGLNQYVTAQLEMYDGGSNTQCAITSTITVGYEWETLSDSSPLGSCALAANSYVTFVISLSSVDSESVRVGDISFDYRSKF
jgi:hypothetical protein